jgi:spoIIIJ-associated protein
MPLITFLRYRKSKAPSGGNSFRKALYFVNSIISAGELRPEHHRVRRRVRRRRSLQKMAEKMAERAINTQRRVVLEAMPAHERRLIHLALRDHAKVVTKSIGSDDNRKVTIIPK